MMSSGPRPTGIRMSLTSPNTPASRSAKAGLSLAAHTARHPPALSRARSRVRPAAVYRAALPGRDSQSGPLSVSRQIASKLRSGAVAAYSARPAWTTVTRGSSSAPSLYGRNQVRPQAITSGSDSTTTTSVTCGAASASASEKPAPRPPISSFCDCPVSVARTSSRSDGPLPVDIRNTPFMISSSCPPVRRSTSSPCSVSLRSSTSDITATPRQPAAGTPSVR
jgi:hypothetical protein